MGLLPLVWTVALTFLVTALVWMGALMVLRLFNERAQSRRAAGRLAVDAVFVKLLQGDPAPPSDLEPYASDPLLMAESLLSLLGQVRGNGLDIVVTALCEAGVDRVLRDTALTGLGPTRLASVEALGAFPGPATQRVLSQAARRGGPRVRLAALRSLLQAGGKVPVARLLNHVERQQLPLSRRLAELLCMAVGAEPTGAIVALDGSKLTPRTRVMIIEALGELDSPQAIKALMRQAEFPHAEVRASAVAAIGKLAGFNLPEPLIRAMQDEDWRVRCAAAEVRLHDPSAAWINAMMILVRDDVWLVREAAEAGLARLGVASSQTPRAVLLANRWPAPAE